MFGVYNTIDNNTTIFITNDILNAFKTLKKNVEEISSWGDQVFDINKTIFRLNECELDTNGNLKVITIFYKKTLKEILTKGRYEEVEALEKVIDNIIEERK